MKPRILVINSYRDYWDVSADSPIPEDIPYPIRSRQYDAYWYPALPNSSLIFGNEPNYEELYKFMLERISYGITTLQPDILLLHTGAAFSHIPVVFLKVFAQLREHYPKLRILYEDKSKFYQKSIDDDDPYTQGLSLLASSGIFDGVIDDLWNRWVYR